MNRSRVFWGALLVASVSGLAALGWYFLPSWGGEGPAWFLDVSEQVGLRAVHDPGPLNGYPMPQIMGSGAALFDFDNDGRLDVYLLNNGGPEGRKNQLFRQLEDGTFRDVS